MAPLPAIGLEASKELSSLPAGETEFLLEALGITEDAPRLSWLLPEESSVRMQSAYQIRVGSQPGGSDLWDTGRVPSAANAVSYLGKGLEPHQQAYWQVRIWANRIEPSDWSEPKRWSRGPKFEADWLGSIWIGADDTLENTQKEMPGDPATPPEPAFKAAPYLRKEFQLAGPVRCALLYVSGLGYAELYLNGKRISDTERDPPFSDYNRRVLYTTHDVTSLLGPGNNALGAILGTGWYDVHDVATWHFNTAPWRRRPKLRLALAVMYADGSSGAVVSDASWSCGTGAILRDGIYTGEIFDARLEPKGWSSISFQAAGWTPALPVEPPRGRLVPAMLEPIRVTRTISAVAIHEPTPGTFIVDLGENFAGHAQLSVRGPAGHAVTMRYGEILHPDGTLDTSPIDHFMMRSEPRQPFQQDTYLCAGTGRTEVWEQRFSYAGFRYVELTNFPGKPTLETLKGRFAHTDLRSAGSFACSNVIANGIQRATCQSYLSNAQGYPTDCPQREKNGWTGDAGLAVQCGLFNFRSEAFYRKWLLDFQAAQRADGGLPVLVPNGGWGNGEGWPGEVTPPWDAAYPIITWALYRHTGDLRILVSHEPTIRRYIDFFLRHRDLGGLVPGLGLGDWFPWKTVTPLDFISNCYLYRDLTLLVQIETALNNLALAQKYGNLAQQLALAIHAKFYDATAHRYAGGSQTAQSLALYFNLVPETEQAVVFADLCESVSALRHIDTGILGASSLLRTLSAGGRSDLAFELATQTSMPGWGYWIAQGATTLWEGWQGGPSYNHIMFGDISAWLYEWIAGIQQDTDGVAFRKIHFRPNPVGDLTNVSASISTQQGVVSCSWHRSGQRMQLTLAVPCGAMARVTLPAGASFASKGFSQPHTGLGSLLPGSYDFEIHLPNTGYPATAGTKRSHWLQG